MTLLPGDGTPANDTPSDGVPPLVILSAGEDSRPLR